MGETRFAILIGMNNYISNELPYCIKDVNDLQKSLESNCRFHSENIHRITDSKKPVKEQIDKAFSKISQEFKPKTDLLFFYFSGHGEYDADEGKSKLLFQDDTELTIEDVLLRYFIKLTPKNQYLIIDACHSGSNVFFKGSNNPEKEIRRLNYHSSELCLMFATESKKKAIQSNDIKNSYFTFFLLEAIKKSTLYDDDGYLTIQAIDNYIKKKVLEKSDFIQVPVSEIRSSGYKVFSFNENKIKLKGEMKEKGTTAKSKHEEQANKEKLNKSISFKESLIPENRKKVQEKLSTIIEQYFNELITNLNESKLDVTTLHHFSELEPSEQQKIFKRIIEKSRKEDIEAIDGLFEIEKREEKKINASFFNLTSIIDHLYEKSKPEFDYRIYTYSDDIFVMGLKINAKDVFEVSCGIFVLFYQAKYGFAISIIKYNYSWSGTNESQINYLNVETKPFLLNEDNDISVSEYLKNNIEDFAKTAINWNEQRKKEINKFKVLVKK